MSRFCLSVGTGMAACQRFFKGTMMTGQDARLPVNSNGKLDRKLLDMEAQNGALLKIEAIREDLGSVGPVIAQQITEAMLGRRNYMDTASVEPIGFANTMN